MDNERIDQSLTEMVDSIDEKLSRMNVEEKKEFLDYLQATVEDLATDVEHDLQKFYSYR